MADSKLRAKERYLETPQDQARYVIEQLHVGKLFVPPDAEPDYMAKLEDIAAGNFVKTYEVVQGRPYGSALVNLHKKCRVSGDGFLQPRIKINGKEVIRHLSFGENLEARVWMYKNAQTEEERMRLLKVFLDCDGGIVYAGGSHMFKIVPHCSDLLLVSPDFAGDFVSVDYNAECFADVRELDSGDSGVVYNRSLPKKDVLVHPAWLAAVKGKEHIWEECVDIVFFELNRQFDVKEDMGVYVVETTGEDQLRALFVSNLGSGSFACANGNFVNYAYVLRVAHKML